MDTTKFFATLERRSETDTAIISTLRRSLRDDPGVDAKACRLLEPMLPTGISNNSRKTVYLTAGLWGLVIRRTRGKPLKFASAMRKIASNNSIESRFVRLLDADIDELPHRLRSALTLIASEKVAIDWAELLTDLQHWSWPSRSVQQSWAREFWRASTEP